MFFVSLSLFLYACMCVCRNRRGLLMSGTHESQLLFPRSFVCGAVRDSLAIGVVMTMTAPFISCESFWRPVSDLTFRGVMVPHCAEPKGCWTQIRKRAPVHLSLVHRSLNGTHSAERSVFRTVLGFRGALESWRCLAAGGVAEWRQQMAERAVQLQTSSGFSANF